jgi:phospholipase C
MQPASAIPAFRAIEHVVVLMLENRSFDNLLGWLYRDQAPPRGQRFDGLEPGLFNPLTTAPGEPPVRVPVGEVDCRTPDGYRSPKHNPAEGFHATNEQLFGVPEPAAGAQPTNLGFANSFARAIAASGAGDTDAREIMRAFHPRDVPVLASLAREYAVCDRWFGSVPSMTLPNRAFAHCGTSTGAVDNAPNPYCDAATVFNRLHERLGDRPPPMRWRIYSATPRSAFDARGTPPDADIGAVFASLTRLVMRRLHDPALDENFDPLERFFEDARTGTLPAYGFIEPHFFDSAAQSDQHPPADIRPGEALIHDVYASLVASPCWEKTLLIVTYDEHGGCYDHVPPPAAVPPDPGAPPGQYGFTFDRLGPRVPTVVVSPYIERGTIFGADRSPAFDHTSILATLRACFDLGAPLSARDAAAPDLGFLLTRRTPRTDRPGTRATRPAPIRPNRTGQADGLARIAEHALAELSARARAPGETTVDYIHAAYAAHFGRGSRRRSR